MMTRVFAQAAIFACVTLPVSVAAQSQGPALALSPRVGWGFGTDGLGRSPTFASLGYVEFDELEGAPFFGLALEASWTSRLATRVVVDRSLDAEAPGLWQCAPFVACPAVIVEVAAEAHVWSFGLDVLWTPAIGPAPVDPYLFGGIGLLRRSFSWGDIEPDLTLPTGAFDDTEPEGRFGLGVKKGGGTTAFYGEVVGSVSRFGQVAEQFIEGAVPESRNTHVELAAVIGIRLSY